MKAKMTVLTLVVLTMLLGIPTTDRAQGTVQVGRERHVIPSYVEPNTPGAPGVTADPALVAAITDPAAFDADGTLNLNKAIYVRTFDRNRTEPPAAIIVLIPGTVAGANSYKIAASEIVQLSGGRFEVWAIDRRTNLLEDIMGLIPAENARTQEAVLDAINYYLNNPAGRGGYIAANPFSVSSFLSGWGLDVNLRDFKAIVDQARTVTPNIFLGGHSLGAIMAQMFAGYNFDGTAGFELIKGLVIMDLTAAPGAPGAEPISDETYLNGGTSPLGPVPGLNQLRNPSQPGHEPFLVSPFSPSLFQLAEIGALLALIDPDGPSVLRQFAPEFVPVPATNAVALAVNIDDEFQANPTFRFSIGVPAVPPGMTLEAVATRISDPAAANPNGIYTLKDLSPELQRWNPTQDLTGLIPSSVRTPSTVDPSDFNTVMRAFLLGGGDGTAAPGDTNFIEWYFSIRMVLDIFKVFDLGRTPLSPTVIAAQTARGGNPITLTENRRVNVPVLAIRAVEGALQSPPPFSPNLAFVFYRQSTSIPGNALIIREMRNYAHVDILTSLERRSTQGKNVPEFIVEFVTERL